MLSGMKEGKRIGFDLKQKGTRKLATPYHVCFDSDNTPLIPTFSLSSLKCFPILSTTSCYEGVLKANKKSNRVF